VDGLDLSALVTSKDENRMKQRFDPERAAVHALSQRLHDERRVGHRGQEIRSVFCLVGWNDGHPHITFGGSLDKRVQLPDCFGKADDILLGQPVLGDSSQQSARKLLDGLGRHVRAPGGELCKHIRNRAVLRR